MSLTKSVAVCLALMAPLPVAAQQSAAFWYDQAELLRLPGTEQNLRRAVDIHYSLIQQGYTRSLVPYGEIHLEQGDVQTALRAFEEAAQSGNLYATTRLAVGHAKGEFGDLSQVQAGRELLERLAVNRENSRAILGLSDVYADGIGIEAQPQEALKLLQRLPEDGYALRRMGDLYLSGKLGSVEANSAEIAYRDAISRGRVSARLSLARAYIAQERYDEAVAEINRSVASGDPEALYQLVRWHRDELFGPLSDPTAGLAAMEQLEQTGDIDAKAVASLRVSFAKDLVAAGEFQKANDAIAPAVDAEFDRAQFEVLRWHRDGAIGPLSDPMVAVNQLESLAERGAVDTETENKIRVSLAKKLLADGRFGEASDVLEPAVEANDETATLRFIGWHRDGDFGPLSDPILAARKTEDLLALGSLDADRANSLRVSLAKTLIAEGRFQEASDTVKPAVDAGDNRAVLRYIGWHRDGDFGPLSDASEAAKKMEDLLNAGSLDEPTANKLRVSLTGVLLDEKRYQEAADTIAPAIAAKDPDALFRYARWNLDGSFGPISDTETAGKAIEDVIGTGSIETDKETALRIALADTYIENGRYQDASDTIAPAIEANDATALYRFARWHLEDGFGPLTDKDKGANAMATLLEIGNVEAAAFTSYQFGGPRHAAQNFEHVMSILESAAREGNDTAGRALVRAYRKNPRLVANSRERHRTVLAEYQEQLAPEQLAIETIYANYDTSNHIQSRQRAAAIMADLDNEAFAEGMMELRSLERTSYVYVLQGELEKLGYFDGFQNGLLNRRTLHAVLAFCRDANIIDQCNDGPISKEASEAIVLAIGERKALGLGTGAETETDDDDTSPVVDAKSPASKS